MYDYSKIISGKVSGLGGRRLFRREKRMKYRLSAVLLAVALLTGTIGEVSYAAGAEGIRLENIGQEEAAVSGGDSPAVVSSGDDLTSMPSETPAPSETSMMEETEVLDISDILLQQGGLLRKTEGETGAYEVKLPEYLAIDSAAYLSAEEAFLGACDSFAEELDITKYHIQRSDLGAFVAEVLNTNPRYFYVSGTMRYSYNWYTGQVISLKLSYTHTRSEVEAMLAAFDAAVSQATSGVEQTWTDMEKALYINDYLAQNCQYDGTLRKDFIYSAYGALVNKTAVCQGYALAYLTLAKELGLDCEVVTSDSLNHAWNMIMVNGKYYQVDTTWNDPLFGAAHTDFLGYAGHRYFMKSTAYFQSAEAAHFKLDDWQVTGNWNQTYASDTAYDAYFWNGIDNGFEYINGGWYTFDGTYLAKYTCDGASLARAGELLEITDKWCIWGRKEEYYQSKFAGVASFEGSLYYSTDDTIYQYDFAAGASNEYYTLTEKEKETGYIYSLHITPAGELSYLLATAPGGVGTVCQAPALTSNIAKYTINFNGNGATSGSMVNLSRRRTGTSYQLAANGYKRSGWLFQGWNTMPDGTGAAYADRASVLNLCEADGGIVTLYAQWSLIPYTITYELKNGTNHKQNPASYNIASETIKLKAPKREGYTFEGWYADGAYQQKITEISKGSTGNVTLYAKWTPHKYNIVFKANGAVSGKMTALKNKKYDTSFKLPANKYKRAGYVFVGWSTKANGRGAIYSDRAAVKNLTAKNGKTVTLYAQWRLPFISSTKETVYLGSTHNLKLVGTAIVSAGSSKTSVAEVSAQGRIKPKKAGKTTITLTGKNGKTYKCAVTVKKPAINVTQKTLRAGQTFTLKLTGTTIKSAVSSKKSVAEVGKNGVVTAKKAGKTTITLKGRDKKSYKCTITVK